MEDDIGDKAIGLIGIALLCLMIIGAIGDILT